MTRSPSHAPVPTRDHRRRVVTHPARLAAVFLLTVWAGPVTFAQTDSAAVLKAAKAAARDSGGTRVVPAGMAMVLKPGTRIQLHMRDGRVLDGEYVGRALLDSTAYADRFTTRARTSAYVPFQLGETLQVSLRDGRDRRAPFAGYAELTLLLLNSEGGEPLRVPFEFATGIQRENGDRVEPTTLAEAFRSGLLPSAEALVLKRRSSMRDTYWSGELRVPVEDIELASPMTGNDGVSTGAVVGVVIVSAVATAALVIWLIGRSIDQSSKNCGKTSFGAGDLSGVQLTKRPFDRLRGCFVGDDLVVAAGNP